MVYLDVLTKIPSYSAYSTSKNFNMKLLNPDLYELVISFMLSAVPAAEHECLALNAYFEARDQSVAGMLGVSQVVLNRVDDPRFPSTICDVVKQGRLSDPIGTPIAIGSCQFSWYCDGKSDTPAEEIAWETAKRKAAHAYYLYDVGYDITEGATHYHTESVSPAWADTITRIGDIDDHIFYRWE